MSVAVFTLDRPCLADISPSHFSNRCLAVALVAARVASWVGEKRKAIQLLVKESWGSIKQRFRPIEPVIGVTLVPRSVLNAPDSYHCPNMLAYPPQGYESNAKQRQAEVWRRATKF